MLYGDLDNQVPAQLPNACCLCMNAVMRITVQLHTSIRKPIDMHFTP